MISPLTSLAPLQQAIPFGETAAADSGGAGAAFGQVLQQLLAGNASANAKAGQAVNDLATGNTNDLHTVSIAVAQADLSFRLILELRNRLTEAYQSVMNMQI